MSNRPVPVSGRLEIPVAGRPALLAVGTVLFGLAAAVFAFIALAGHSWPAGVLAACSGVFALLSGLNLRPSPPWVLTRQGFQSSGPAGGTFYSWDEVRGFRPGPTLGTFGVPIESISFDLEEGHERPGIRVALSVLTRLVARSDRTLPNNSMMPRDQLVATLNSWRKTYAGRGGPA